jgi:hypothetical protein
MVLLMVAVERQPEVSESHSCWPVEGSKEA